MKLLLYILAFVSITSYSQDPCSVKFTVANEVRGVGQVRAVLLVDGFESVECMTSWSGWGMLYFMPEEGKEYSIRLRAQGYHEKVVKLKKTEGEITLEKSIIMKPTKDNLIPGVTIPWDREAWEMRSNVR